MFGLGRRKDEEVRRLQARESELSHQLEQAQQNLLEASKRAEAAESQSHFLASQNRALAAKVHRLTLQRVELQNDKDHILLENRELHIANLKLEGEAHVAKAAKADAWQVTNLKTALRQQAAQHEKKMASLKRRTKALLTTLLPGVGHSRRASAGGLLPPGEQSAPGSPSSDSPFPDLWDAPLSPTVALEYNQPDVHSRVRQIISCLYDETLTEDQALEQMVTLTSDLGTLPQPVAALSRGCSPLPVPKVAAGEAVVAADKVDAATDMITARARFHSDVATETPAEMSYIGTPQDISATPSEVPTSPRRLGHAGVPTLDLAALVAQAMEDAPQSARSTASTSVGGAGSSFNAFSQFVLAQPEKLQRLIMRHAAATGAKSSGLSRPSQSSYAGGLLPTAAAAAAAGNGPVEPLIHTAGTSSMEPVSLPGSMALGSRPSLTSRLLGLGGNVSNNRANIAAAPAATSPAPSSTSTAAAGVLLPSSAGNTTSPVKGVAKRPTISSAPKFVSRDGPAPTSSRGGIEAPVTVMLSGARFLTGHENSSSVGGGTAGVGMLGQMKLNLENDLKDLHIGGSSAVAVASSVGVNR